MDTRSSDLGSSSVYNRYEVMRRFEYDLGAFEDLVELFASCCPEDLETLHAAVDEGDSDEVSRITQRFKDAANSFASDPVRESIDRLEEAVEQGIDQSGAKDLMSRLEDDLDTLQAALVEALGQ